ncbi:MAG: toxin-antitoxin system HicB family antitoxin [Planctomycetales bacterium]
MIEAIFPKKREALRVAEGFYKQQPEWVVFFREILGVNGVIRKLFPTGEEWTAFEASPEFAAIHRMLHDLRKRDEKAGRAKEDVAVVTVRMPRELHESLKEEAEQKQTSLNKLCVSKLLHKEVADDRVLQAG